MVRTGVAVIIEPRSTLPYCERPKVERDGGVDDVVVVDVGECVEIVERRRSNRVVGRSRLYGQQSPETERPAPHPPPLLQLRVPLPTDCKQTPEKKIYGRVDPGPPGSTSY